MIESCYNLKENCVGGPGNTSRELCFVGHAGGLCESCDIYGTIWGEPYCNFFHTIKLVINFYKKLIIKNFLVLNALKSVGMLELYLY